MVTTAVRDRLLLGDPGLVRATFALRTLASLGVAGLACAAVAGLAAQGPSGTVLGVVAAQLTVLLARQPERRARILTCFAMLPGSWAGVTLLYLLRDHPWLDIALVPALIAGGFLAQAVHARLGATILAAAWVVLFTLYLQAQAAPLAWHLAAVTLGTLGAMAVRFVLWPDDRTLGARLLVRTHRLVLADFARGVARHGGPASLTRLLTRMQPVANAVVANPRIDVALRESLADLRLAVEMAVLRDESSADSLSRALRAGSGTPAAGCVDGRVDGRVDEAVDRAAVRVDALVRRSLDVRDPLRTRAASAVGGAAISGTARRLAVERAVQVLVATSVATVGGYLVSERYWPWAVIVAMMLYLGTESAGHVLDKGVSNATGVLLGVCAGVGLTGLPGSVPRAEIALAAGALGLALYVMPVTYAAGSALITLAIGLLYEALGRPVAPVLELRLAEVLVGAIAGISAALLVLRRDPRTLLRARAAEFLDALADALDPAAPAMPRAELRRRFAATATAADLGRLGGLLVERSRVRAALADLSRLLHLVEVYRSLGSGPDGTVGTAGETEVAGVAEVTGAAGAGNTGGTARATSARRRESLAVDLRRLVVAVRGVEAGHDGGGAVLAGHDDTPRDATPTPDASGQSLPHAALEARVLDSIRDTVHRLADRAGRVSAGTRRRHRNGGRA